MSSALSRILLFVLAGLAAGFLTWMVSDGSGLIHLSDTTTVLTSREAFDYQLIFMTWGGCIGVVLGLAEIFASGQLSQWLRVVGFGLLVGIAAGIIGGKLGETLFGAIYVTPAANSFDFLRNVLARAIGWAVIGALAGTAAGWRKLSVRAGRNGLFGGLLGGLIGGAAFEIVPYIIPGKDDGALARAIAFLITGATIGLFVALVQELFKEAWVRVVVGRNEGKEILIEKAETKIGRAELSDISLYGDPNVARTHALIVAQPNGTFLLRDVSQSPLGIRVNDQVAAGDVSLHSGDRIQIAKHLLVFHERMARERTVPERRDVGTAPRLPQTPFPNTVSGSINPQNSNRAAFSSHSLSPGPAAQTFGPPPIGRREITAEAHLVATSGPYTGTVFPVRNGATIGRDPEAEIALPADTKMSRAHARMIYVAPTFTIEDNASTNGVFVNGQRVGRQSLVQGDTIIIGTSVFRYE